MSGGHWQYVGSRIRDALEQIAGDEETRQFWPKTSRILMRLAFVLYDIEHDMDWALSADTRIEDVNDEEMVKRLRAALKNLEDDEDETL